MQGIRQLKTEIGTYLEHLWTYTKYQLVTKGVFFLGILPLFYMLMEVMFKAAGRVALSSGDYKSFLFSSRGVSFFVMVLFISLLIIIIDINSLIALSASTKTQEKPLTVKEALLKGVGSIKSFASPAGVLLLLYALLVVPLSGVGLKISLIKNLKLPNFITDVIYDNATYLTVYLVVLAAFAGIGFFLLFSFHFMQLRQQSAKASVKKSIRLVWTHKGAVLKNIVMVNGVLLLVTAAAGFGMYLIVEMLGEHLIRHVFWSRFIMMFLLFTFAVAANLWFFLIGPLQIHLLTGRFYAVETAGDKTKCMQDVRPDDSVKMERPKNKRSRRHFRWLFCFFMLFNLMASGLSAFFFDDIFRYRPAVAIVAHRGGGDLGAENTVLGLQAAIEAGAEWSEIDVMRSKDGVYVINHDRTFARLTGKANRPSELTWDEIKVLEVKDTFHPERASGTVPDLDTIMDTAKGEIGLLIELKGADADKKMADDVVEAIRRKKMDDEAVIISLNYSLIEYIEKTHPEIQTGYLYFFSLGDTSKLETDYLIMEEAMVSAKAVEKIHHEGKKALVWTVNHAEAVDSLLEADVDGIITDHVVDIQKAIRSWDAKSDVGIILDAIKKTFTK